MSLSESLTEPRTVRIAFRVVAVAEALSWLGLLTGMYFKWIAETTERGVEIFGPIHGGIFIAYVVLTIVTAQRFSWGRNVTLLGLVAAIPPFATVIFDVWAERHGKLDAAELAAGEPAASAPKIR